MNRTDVLGAAAVYEQAQGLVPCHRATGEDGKVLTAVIVPPEAVPHRDEDGFAVEGT